MSSNVATGGLEASNRRHAAGCASIARSASSVFASGSDANIARSIGSALSPASAGSGTSGRSITSKPEARARLRHACTTHDPPCRLMSAADPLSCNTTRGSSITSPFASWNSPCTQRFVLTGRENCERRNSPTRGPVMRTTAIAAAPGGVIRIARLRVPIRKSQISGLVFDVMLRVRQSDAVKRQVRGDGVDEFPVFEQRLRVAASGDDVGPVAQRRRIALCQFLDHPADAVEGALEDGLLGRVTEGTARAGERNARELGRFLVESVELHRDTGGDCAAEELALIVAAVHGDRGTGIDDDAPLPHLLERGGDVEHAVDAGLRRLFRADLDRHLDLLP